MPPIQPASTEPATVQPPTNRPRRQRLWARRTGYVLVILINAALLYAVNFWPGWERLPIVTTDAGQVVGLLNAVLSATIAVNLGCVIWDPPVVRAGGGILTTALDLALLVRVWQVFPFALTADSFDAELVTRVALGFVCVAVAIGLVVQMGQFAKLVLAGDRSAAGSVGEAWRDEGPRRGRRRPTATGEPFDPPDGGHRP